VETDGWSCPNFVEPNVSLHQRSADESRASCRRATPCRASAPRPFYGDLPTPIVLELFTMDETARKNAAEALQRALDRRDNGGRTGHEPR
jgi:hypothetical protein